MPAVHCRRANALAMKSDINKCGERIVKAAIVAPQTGHRGAQRVRQLRRLRRLEPRRRQAQALLCLQDRQVLRARVPG